MIFARKVDEMNKKPDNKPPEEKGGPATKSVGKGFWANWWNNLDKDSSPGQKFVLFTMALLVGYIEFHFLKSVWSMLVIVLFAALYRPPKGWVGITFVTIDGVVLILAMFFQGFAEMRHTSYDIADTWSTKAAKSMATYAKEIKNEKPTVSQSSQQSAIVPAVYQPEKRMVELFVTPDSFTPVQIPSGAEVAIDCPPEGLAKVFYRQTPQGIIYDCAHPINIGKNREDLQIGFSSKEEPSVRVRVILTL